MKVLPYLKLSTGRRHVMKKILGTSLGMLAAGILLTGCAGWDTVATVGGGTGWYSGDNAPYYWSDWNVPVDPPAVGNGPGSIVSSGWANNQSNPPIVGNGPGSVTGNPNPAPNPNPGNPGAPNVAPSAPNNTPSAPPAGGNGPGSNPGSPSQGGFRGQK